MTLIKCRSWRYRVSPQLRTATAVVAVMALCTVQYIRIYTGSSKETDYGNLTSQRYLLLTSSSRATPSKVSRENLPSTEDDVTDSQDANRSNSSLDEIFMKTNQTRMVLLITAARSGSSWTAELIHTSPGVFFVFEPLGILQQHFHDGNYSGDHFEKLEERVTLVNGTSIWQKSVEWIESYLQCDPKEASNYVNPVFLRKPDMNEFTKCIQNNALPGAVHTDCYSRMTDRCRASDVILVKSVRFRLRWAESLLRDYPGLRVLLLLRDPRAVLFSRAQLKVFRVLQLTGGMAGLAGHAADLCADIRDDVRAARSLQAQFPGRVKALRYEDGALDPLTYTRDIYSFLQMRLTQNVQDHVMMLSGPNKPKGSHRGPYGTSRINSSEGLQKWRTSATDGPQYFRFAKKVDYQCLHVYPVLGYRRIESKDDFYMLNRSLLVPPLPFAKGGIF